MRRWKRLGSDERGQGVVEMALVFFILLFLAAGAADLGRAMYTWIVIHNAAREGARYGSHFPWDEAGIVEVTIAEAAESGVALTADQITIPYGLNAAGGNPIRVAVEYNLPTILAGIPQLGLSTLTIVTGAEMIIYGIG